MKANEFVKKHGCDSFKAAVICPQFKRYNYAILYYDEVDFSNEFIEKRADYMFKTSEIKRLVESHGLVKEHGSLGRAKEYADSAYTAPEVAERLHAAIADVESCMEEV